VDAPLALYRRYRPDTFADVIGQAHVTGPLSAALENNRVSHAYLFSGPRGCGKTTSARILARALNCETGPSPTPCGTCESCVELARGGPGSVDVIEIDAASHGGVEDARELRERAFFAPMKARYKVYIIDEAHMVTTQGPAQARRGAARASAFHLRHHRARQGHRHDPVAHAPLPLPARTAEGSG
jgi:DNA polymerase-3 subunit gamma/tau